VLPHWNAKASSYAVLCRILNGLGYSALLLTLPYHGPRRPHGCHGAEYAVSANLGRTVAAARQTVAEVRSCLDWLGQQGYVKFGLIGTSLGSGFGFLASAHDARLEVNVFNHCCATISDAVWEGMPRIRRVLEPHLPADELRRCWRAIHANSYFRQMARFPKTSLLIAGRYDTVFPRQYVREVIRLFSDFNLRHEVTEFACGHESLGKFPYVVMDCYRICSFVRQNL
jgi:dienelactone hydrolase